MWIYFSILFSSLLLLYFHLCCWRSLILCINFLSFFILPSKVLLLHCISSTSEALLTCFKSWTISFPHLISVFGPFFLNNILTLVVRAPHVFLNGFLRKFSYYNVFFHLCSLHPSRLGYDINTTWPSWLQLGRGRNWSSPFYTKIYSIVFQ